MRHSSTLFPILILYLIVIMGCSAPDSDKTVENRLKRDNDLWVQRQIEEDGLSVTLWKKDFSEPEKGQDKIDNQIKLISLLESNLDSNRQKLIEWEIQSPPDKAMIEHYRRLVRSQEIQLARERSKLAELQGKQSVFDSSYNHSGSDWFDQHANEDNRDSRR